LLNLLCQQSQPALDVAGGADELVLQIDFGFASVTRPAQSMSAHQLALSRFDPIEE
jgi:hypothetical protein